MKIWTLTLFLPCFVASPALASSTPYSDIAERAFAAILYEPDAQELASLPPLSIDGNHAKLVLDDPQQTMEYKLLAASIYVEYLLDVHQLAEAALTCKLYPPAAEHYEYRANCLRADPRPIEQISRALEDLADEAAVRFPKTLASYYVFNVLGVMLNNAGRTHEALRIYKKAIELLPPGDETVLMDAKIHMAIVYANPLLSKTLQRNAIEYYKEVIAYFQSLNPGPGMFGYREIWANTYNLAIALLFNFQDYEAAIHELKKVIPTGVVHPDDQVFLAYALAKAGRKEEARIALREVKWDKSLDGERTTFLKCYSNLTLRLIGDNPALTDCQNMVSPQPDVLLDVTSAAAKLTLKPEEAAAIFGMFYRYFERDLKPGVQQSMDSAITVTDLEREKAAGRLKGERLKNMVLYQRLSYALVGIIAVCALALFLAIRSWRVSRRHAREMGERKTELQTIIDNIEEGLVRIVEHGRLEPQVSPHLLHITGGQDLRGKTLFDFMSLTNLSEDAIAIAIQCLEATIGEDVLNWEINLSNLPTAVKIADREIALFWQMQAEQGIAQAVLLVMRDVTALNALHRQSDQQRENADRMLVYAREILACNPKSVQSFLGELPGLMRVIANRNEEAKKVAHTIKGTARTLGLQDLQNIMHRFEDQLKNPAADWNEIMPVVENIGSTYCKACEHVLGKGQGGATQTLLDLLVLLRPGLEKQLNQGGVAFGTFSVEESTRLQAAEREAVQDALLHGLTNAVDHGFILPRQRGQTIADAASFHIRLEARDGEKILTLRDNGVGINHIKIRELAAKRQWQPQPGQIWTDFLFEEGVSTASEVSMTSGRGVGLAAIRSAARDLAGSVQLLDSESGQGSQLCLRWPLTKSPGIIPAASA